MTAPRDTSFPFLTDQLRAVGEGAPALDAKLQLVRAIRGSAADAGDTLDRFFVEELTRLRQGIVKTEASQEKLREIIAKLTAAPFHPALYLGATWTDRGLEAMVLLGSSRRVVSMADGVDPESLAVGDEVLLGHELNVVMGRSPYPMFPWGETAFYERPTADGRLVLRSRDEEIIVAIASGLKDVELKRGDLVRWDRNAWMAFEKIDSSKGEELFLEETPRETFDDIGGLSKEIEKLREPIVIHMKHPELVRKYRLRRKKSVLLAGPPGTGKTMMARALANWLATVSRSGRARFMYVKPAGFHSPWFGESEANYRKAFRLAREAGEVEPEVPVVVFFDEVDSIAAARGESHMRIDDRVLTAFMTELDGLESRGNVLVVTATNRRDALDPALAREGRLGDVVIQIPRPDRKAARDIFSKYLPEDVPFAHGTSRWELIDAALSRLYAPNGAPALATIVFSDGNRRAVTPADVMSGAVIAKIARNAGERTLAREVATGEAGIAVEDLLTAVEEACEIETSVLTPFNCRKYLADLPQDVQVVSVERPRRKVVQMHKYLTVA